MKRASGATGRARPTVFSSPSVDHSPRGKTPSLSIDPEKCVFHCFGCGAEGGVKKFADLVGEPWNATRRESRTAKAHRARLQAECQARAILTRRAEERDKALCARHRELYGKMLVAKDLLELLYRRFDLAAEFPDLVAAIEKEYGEALFRLSLVEALLDGWLEDDGNQYARC